MPCEDLSRLSGYGMEMDGGTLETQRFLGFLCTVILLIGFRYENEVWIFYSIWKNWCCAGGGYSCGEVKRGGPGGGGGGVKAGEGEGLGALHVSG